MQKETARTIVTAKIAQLNSELDAMNLVLTGLDTGDQLNEAAVAAAIATVKATAVASAEELNAAVDAGVAKLG